MLISRVPRYLPSNGDIWGALWLGGVSGGERFCQRNFAPRHHHRGAGKESYGGAHNSAMLQVKDGVSVRASRKIDGRFSNLGQTHAKFYCAWESINLSI